MPVKLSALLQSRKFWALVASLVAIGLGAYNGVVTPTVAIQSAVTALAAYAIGTGLDDSGKTTPAP